MNASHEKTLSRREFFRGAGLAGLTCMAAGLAVPRGAEASTVESLIAEKMGGDNITMAKVNLGTPDTAENGALVRVPVSVDHPMDADNHVQSLAVFVDNNPKPFVALYEFSPAAGKVDLEFRIRMAGSSKLRVVAKNNKGELFGVMKEIAVAAGGCAN
ncbi:MAG: thiosulfate oxidation carrier protein SoxY [Magnetococcales bacterium]|nr:thiosulfate oxidation carrier protein SoxY [Magnetococcales bacterium]